MDSKVLSQKILTENLERETGIEPATTGLGSRCSTIELLPPRTAGQTIILRHAFQGHLPTRKLSDRTYICEMEGSPLTQAH
jgi:hypothetical protein